MHDNAELLKLAIASKPCPQCDDNLCALARLILKNEGYTYKGEDLNRTYVWHKAA